MKLNFVRNQIETSGKLEEFQFGIKSSDMGIILEILRSKMYSNPIEAICREIASNSRDANREVNKDSIPIRISFQDSIFSPGELTVSFSDDGPGISPERMSDVFVNYGSSTKRDTNKLTGGYGLGAKTPFAYTDSFSIVTKVDKVKYTYIAAIEENNTGKIYLMNKEKTKEENGTSIIVPVSLKDRNTYERQIIKTTFFWKIKPEYINFKEKLEFFKFEVIEKYDNVLMTNSTYLFNTGLYALIDEIPYELNENELKISFNHNYCLFISFKTGELTVSANRETVQYDEKTKTKILKKYELFRDFIHNKILEKINSCKSYFEASIKFFTISKEYQKFLELLHDNKKDEFKFQNNILIKELPIDLLQIIKIVKSGNSIDKQPICRFLPDMEKTPFYANDLSKLQKSRNLTIFKISENFYSIEIKHRDLKKFSKLDFKTKKSFAKQMRKTLNELEDLKKLGFKFKLYSSLNKSKEEQDQRVQNDKPKEREYVNVRYLYNGRRGKTSLGFNKKLLISDLNPTPSLVYCIAEKFDKDIKLAEFLHNQFKICTMFISRRNAKYFTKFSTLEEKIKEISKSDKLQKSVDYNFISSSRMHNSYKMSYYKKLNFKNGFQNSIKIIEDLTSESHLAVPTELKHSLTVSEKIKKAVEKTQMIEKEYPLLAFIDGSGSLKEFNRYINLIDKEREELNELTAKN